MRQILQFILAITSVATTVAFAQDTRTVTEPVIPPVCRSLDAQLTALRGTLDEADESKLDTARIQQAIDGCQPGTAVQLRSAGQHNAFLSGPLELRQGITLLVAEKTTLFASRNPRDYDVKPGSCGIVDENGKGCKPLIAVNKAKNAAIMGDGAIDGRGGAKLLGQNVTWWDLAEKARTPSTAKQNVPRILVASAADGLILYRITLRNSPNFHVIVYRTDGFTAWGVRIDTPKTARNTDGIDPASSTNVSILHSYIHTGDDNVAIKAGAMGASTHMTIAHNHFYTGHGMSIGSETDGGASDILVEDLTIDGADNGLRIKSNPKRGGLVRGISYRDVCIRDTKNPIVMETTYERQTAGTLIPRFEDIGLQNVRVLGPGKITVDGYDAQHPVTMTLDGVDLTGVRPEQIHFRHAKILTAGPGQVNFFIGGDDVQIVHLAGDHKVLPCDPRRFEPFPSATRSDAAPPVNAAHANAKRSVVVAADGSGDFRSVQNAVEALPVDGGTVSIRPGTYREVVHVTKPHVRLEGDPADPRRVVIVYDKHAGSAGGTLNSATVDIRADDFFARGITFGNDWWVEHPDGGHEGPAQALAVSVSGDREVFRNVRFLGAQDTLYVGSKGCLSEQGPCTPTRQFFEDCYVEGHVDFIFGDAKAYFRNCEIHAIAHKSVMLTAQSRHYPEMDSGFVFDRCKITADPAAETVYFGRPWRPYSTVIFMNTDIEAKLAPAGWSEWHPGETHSLETATYREYRSTGPGANDAARDAHARQLTPAEAQKYSVKAFLSGADGWDPEKAR